MTSCENVLPQRFEGRAEVDSFPSLLLGRASPLVGDHYFFLFYFYFFLPTLVDEKGAQFYLHPSEYEIKRVITI